MDKEFLFNRKRSFIKRRGKKYGIGNLTAHEDEMIFLFNQKVNKRRIRYPSKDISDKKERKY